MYSLESIPIFNNTWQEIRQRNSIKTKWPQEKINKFKCRKSNTQPSNWKKWSSNYQSTKKPSNPTTLIFRFSMWLVQLQKRRKSMKKVSSSTPLLQVSVEIKNKSKIRKSYRICSSCFRIRMFLSRINAD